MNNLAVARAASLLERLVAELPDLHKTKTVCKSVLKQVLTAFFGHLALSQSIVDCTTGGVKKLTQKHREWHGKPEESVNIGSRKRKHVPSFMA